MKYLLLYITVMALLALAQTSPCKGYCGFIVDDNKSNETDIQNTTHSGYYTYEDLVKRGEAGGEWWWWTSKKRYTPRRPDNK